MTKSLKVLVTGSEGQLGNSLKSVINESNNNINFDFLNKKNLDITNYNFLKSFFKNNNFDIILNFAAYTAVDKAETDSLNAHKVNTLGVENLARIGNEFNIFIIHISTDYVFDGKNKDLYTEKDKTFPLNEYGKSKLEGENKLNQFSTRYLIIRVSWLYSEFNKNFFKSIVEKSKKENFLNIVNDQIGSPTYAVDFSIDLIKIIEKIYQDFFHHKEYKEVFHYCNLGTTSWHGFASEIVKNTDSNIQINKIKTDFLQLAATRPSNSSLNPKKIQDAFGIKINTWQESLLNCINNMCIKN